MKVFVCGSLYPDKFPDPEEREEIVKASLEIGRELGKRGCTLIVATDLEESVDRYIVDGALEAIKATRKLTVEIYWPGSMEGQPFSSLIDKPNVKLDPHRVDSPSWHVAHMRAVKNCDCVILLGGRTGTLVSGLTSMLTKTPFIPIACFGGEAREAYKASLTDYREYYFNALTQNEVDYFEAPWKENESAKRIVDMLFKIRDHRNKKHRLSIGDHMLILLGLLGIGIFFIPLLYSYSEHINAGMFFLTLASIGPGLSLSCISIWQSQKSDPTSLNLGEQLVKGVVGGFLAFLLMSVTQMFIKGNVSLGSDSDEFRRFMIIAGLAGAYGGYSGDEILGRLSRIGRKLVSK